MKEFASNHPWMTFFLALGTISLVGDIVVSVVGKRPAALPPAPGTPAIAGLRMPSLRQPWPFR